MQAIVLVGGLGTRLQSVVTDIPKPMAPIQGKPFLAYLLDYLEVQGITHVIFPIYYLGERIRTYFQSRYQNIDIQYIEEKVPLGTGGAIFNAFSLIDHTQPCFVLNGDTLLKLDYSAMYKQHIQQQAVMTIALKMMNDCYRYGKVLVEQERIIAFHEKGEEGPGLINGGVYLFNPTLFSTFNLPQQFSIETDFIIPHLTQLAPQSFIAGDYFIDIGIPEDYARAIGDWESQNFDFVV